MQREVNKSENHSNMFNKIILATGLLLGSTACMGTEVETNGLQDVVLSEPGIKVQLFDDNNNVYYKHCTDFIELPINEGQSISQTIESNDSIISLHTPGLKFDIQDGSENAQILSEVNNQNINIPQSYNSFIIFPQRCTEL
jgi:hypothetical protein